MSEDIKCRSCGGPTVLAPVHAAGWSDEGYRYWRCLVCGSDSSTAEYSTELYDNDIQANFYEWEYACREVNTNVSLLQQYGAAAGMTFLDYGTGDGAFMLRMQQLGLDVYGVEVSRAALAVIQGRLHLEPGRLFLNTDDLSALQFDVVATREVIEHVVDPREFLDRVVSLVKPGGLVQVQTPRAIDDYHHVVHQKSHLCILSVTELGTLVAGRGCEILDYLTWPIGQCVTARRQPICNP